MTDLTAAQPPFLTGVPEEWVASGMSDDDLVEEAFLAGTKWQEYQDATLIRQQAEQIRRRVEQVDELANAGFKLAQKATALLVDKARAESEVATLRKVIEDAPHEKHCAWLRLEPGIPEHAWGCTCWKSKALPEKETP